MAGDYYEWYPGEYRRDTIALDIEADCLLRRLLDLLHDFGGGRLPDDPEWLRVQARYTKTQWSRAWPQVSDRWVSSDGGLAYAISYRKRHLSRIRAAAGSRGGEVSKPPESPRGRSGRFVSPEAKPEAKPQLLPVPPEAKPEAKPDLLPAEEDLHRKQNRKQMMYLLPVIPPQANDVCFPQNPNETGKSTDLPSKGLAPSPERGEKDPSRCAAGASPSALTHERGRVSEGENASPDATAVPACPHAKIIEAYHATLPANPRVNVRSDALTSHLRTRWREDRARQTLDWWQGYFEYIASRCPFLVGQRSDKPFLPGLEWFVKPSNLAKVCNGNYDEQGRQA